jgi:hypothetical protein
VLRISAEALRHGCERADDLFKLNGLRDQDEAAACFDAVFEALCVDADMRERLQDALLELVPVRGDALAQAALTGSMLAGVLVGLLIADSAIPSDELELPVVPS